MMYAILVLILLFLVSYVLLRWLRMVLLEGGQAARTALNVARGGKTPEILVADARAAFQRDGLTVDFVVASTQAERVLANLNGRLSRRARAAGWPAELVFLLALDIDRKRLQLRGIGPDGPDSLSEFTRFHSFSEVVSIDHVDSPFDSTVVPDVDTAVRIIVDDGEQRIGCLPLERAWHIRPADLVTRIRGMIEDGRRPAVTPVILR